VTVKRRRFETPAAYHRVTRAKRRLPTWKTAVVFPPTRRPLSSTRWPSIRTPPWAIARNASDVLPTKPAAFSRLAIGIPSGASSATSGMSSGTSPRRNRATKASRAWLAATASWKRSTTSRRVGT